MQRLVPIVLLLSLCGIGACCYLLSKRTEPSPMVRAVLIRSETEMNFSGPSFTSGGTVITIKTDQGVNPPGAGLVPGDTGDLSNETAEQAAARHRARLERAKELNPPD